MQKTYYVYSKNGQFMEYYTKDNCYNYGSLWKVRTIMNKYNEFQIKEVTNELTNCTFKELTEKQKESSIEFWNKWVNHK